MPEMKFFNYAGAVQTAENVKAAQTQNALNTYKLQETERLIERRREIDRIKQQHADGPPRIEALRNEGYDEEARELATSWLELEQNRVDYLESVRNAVNEDNWDQFRFEMIQTGHRPELLPETYDDGWFRDEKEKHAAPFKRITQIYGTPEGPMAQDITQIGDEITYGEPYDPAAARATKGQGVKYSSGDAGRIQSGVRNYFGSLVNPKTGEFNKLDRDIEAKIATIQATAENFYVSGRYPSHLAAVQAALAFHDEKVASPDAFNIW